MTLVGAHLRAGWVTPVLLALLTFALYAPTRNFEFVQYDDPIYVIDNPNLRAGLNRESLVRAFTDPYETNWIPLTWVSLQIDHAFFGFDPAGYHLVNAGLHAVSSALLYAAFVAMSGSAGPSLFVAAVFAAHPLHVESVAWVSERKDVLSGFFFMLTLLAYARYAQRREGLSSFGGAVRYAAVGLCFAAGLLAKPMLVTLPVLLLLLDFWPLDRLSGGIAANASTARRLLRLVTEKIPLFAMSAAVALVTVRIQRAAGAVANDRQIEPLIRLGNAFESYWIYLADSLWPRGLSVFYPHPGDTISTLAAAIAAAGLFVATLVCLRLVRSRPYLIVGWFWYLVTLLPVIGIVQAGMQARADRYTYLAQIGLTIALAWTARDAFARTSRWRAVPAAVGGAAIAMLALGTWKQLPHWRDTRALYEQAISATEANFVAHYGLAAELFHQGDYAAAERHYARATEIKPRWSEAHRGHGDSLLAQGRRDEAIASYRKSVTAAPARPLGHVHLAEALVADGQISAAISHFQKALRLYAGDPVPEIHARYAAALAINEEWTEAARQYRYAIRVQPDFAEARSNLAFLLTRMGEYAAARDQFELILARTGDSAEIHAGLASAAGHLGDARAAIRHYDAALQLRPNWVPAANQLAWILATHPDPALRAPRRAAALMDQLRASEAALSPVSLDVLAASQAALGRFEAAVEAAEAAAVLARERGQPALASAIESRRAGYARRAAFIDSIPTTVP